MTLKRIACPACNASRFEHDLEGNLFCAHCGINFGNPQAPIDCPSCGIENPPQARKCMNCGLSLGHVCPACNHHNPPRADYCLECATPLDSLSKILMRTPAGKAHTSKLMKEELVRTKGNDQLYMDSQRILLDEEERHRLQNLRNQQTRAVEPCSSNEQLWLSRCSAWSSLLQSPLY
jgi:hypothetical protein